MTQDSSTINKMYCYRHPDRETRLRCNQCNRPICASCAMLTPTGYRCPECIRSQQKVFDTTQPSDYVVASLVSAAISFAGSWIANPMGFFTVLITPLIGFLIAEIVRWAVRKRRSKTLNKVTMIAATVGSLPLLIYFLVIGLLTGGAGLYLLVWQAVYTTVIASAVYYRLGGTRTRI
jgi:hypothetical protein